MDMAGQVATSRKLKSGNRWAKTMQNDLYTSNYQLGRWSSGAFGLVFVVFQQPAFQGRLFLG